MNQKACRTIFFLLLQPIILVFSDVMGMFLSFSVFFFSCFFVVFLFLLFFCYLVFCFFFNSPLNILISTSDWPHAFVGLWRDIAFDFVQVWQREVHKKVGSGFETRSNPDVDYTPRSAWQSPVNITNLKKTTWMYQWYLLFQGTNKAFVARIYLSFIYSVTNECWG